MNRPRRTAKKIGQLYDALRELRLSGQIQQDTYFKGLTCLASEYCAKDMIEEALGLVSELSEAYVRTVLPAQMEDDAEFRVIATALATKLAESGHGAPADEGLDDVELWDMLRLKPGVA